MTDHPNVMPMSVPKEYQTVKKNHSLEVVSVVLLVVGAGLFVYFNAKIGAPELATPEIPVISLPEEENQASRFSDTTKTELLRIQTQIQTGEITAEEGVRQMENIVREAGE